MLGGLDLVEYVTCYEQVDGIWLATRKDIYRCDSDGGKVGSSPLGRFEYQNPFLTA
jgi:hypothetical protein